MPCSNMPPRGYAIQQGKVKISLASDCNLKCRYCSKSGTIGQACTRTASSAEIVELCKALHSKGFGHAYIGGGGYGEPLLAKDTLEITEQLRKIGFKQVTLVTNGTLLKGNCSSLADAGITSCNISLDTIDERVYAWLCGSPQLDNVLAGIKEAASVFGRVKIITVLLRDINDIEIPEIIEFCRSVGAELQINELVNLDTESSFYDIHYLDPAYLMDELDRRSSYTETIKRDSKRCFYMHNLKVTVRLTKAYSNFAIREDSPIIRPDGKMVWLSHDNVIFDMNDFTKTRSFKDEQALHDAVSAAIDNRLTGVTSEMLRQIEICGSFSRASW